MALFHVGHSTVMSSRDQSSRGASSDPSNNNSSGRDVGGSKSPVLQCEIIQALEDTWTANIFVVRAPYSSLYSIEIGYLIGYTYEKSDFMGHFS